MDQNRTVHCALPENRLNYRYIWHEISVDAIVLLGNGGYFLVLHDGTRPDEGEKFMSL